MDYKYLDSSININEISLKETDGINPFVKKNSQQEIIKGISFLNTDEQFLYVHGFLGTGKRQVIDYICDYLSTDVIKLEYYCKQSTVCDDILLRFIDIIEKSTSSNSQNINYRITTLAVKFQRHIESIQKPFIIVLHSFDDVLDENIQLIVKCLEDTLKHNNVKLIISTRAMQQDVAGSIHIDKKIFLKGFTKDIFKEFLNENNLKVTNTTLDDFYKYTRGYYYYTALVIKIIHSMKITLNDFLEKYTASGMSFDEYIGYTYLNLIPTAIRNFFWFLRTVRHGLTLNALAIFELYDEFSVEYLKDNLMIFQVNDTIYVQDYFLQNIDISIPQKTEIKLHKYIISIYEKMLKEPLQTRAIMISRQALRAEISYHNSCIDNVKNNNSKTDAEPNLHQEQAKPPKEPEASAKDCTLEVLLKNAKDALSRDDKTEAIEGYLKVINYPDIDLNTLVSCRLTLAQLYKAIEDYPKSLHYYELVETYYKHNNEVINLNYLYYEKTEVLFLTYKNARAIETIKKVIYSIDTPRSLMVSACTLLGNIYSSMDNNAEAYIYYQKALDSLDENTTNDVRAELYFKFALANDDKENMEIAYEYYNKCIFLDAKTPYRALAYANLGSCYLDNCNYEDAANCFEKAYQLEKSCNNYDGIYYSSIRLAKIYSKIAPAKALNYYLEAKQCAEFLNEAFYVMEASVALGDYYYNNTAMNKKALSEYLNAKVAAKTLESVDKTKLEQRIADMKLRMNEEEFNEIERKYE